MSADRIPAEPKLAQSDELRGQTSSTTHHDDQQHDQAGAGTDAAAIIEAEQASPVVSDESCSRC